MADVPDKDEARDDVPKSLMRPRRRSRAPAPLRRVYRLLRGLETIPNKELWDIGDRLSFGRHSYGKPMIRHYKEADTSTEVRIGSFVSIADDVVFMLGGEHPTDRVSTYPFRVIFGLEGAYEDGFPHAKGDIVIGSDVWIGRGARVFSGVTVGDGAVIGGNAVVASNVRPYAIVAGNPAEEIRRRFSDEQVEALLRIRWWEWPDEEIVPVAHLLSSSGIDEFIERYDPDRR
jgi:acetyltransferase-like isoleucine patch superfamily enzyme